jgi:outer membrane protein TolC
LLTSSFAGPLLAQTDLSQGLTLPLAVDIALRTNPLIRATASGGEMADAQLGEARASRLPLVQFSETFARSNNPVFVFGSLLEQGRFGPQNFDPRFLNNPDPLSNFRTSLAFRLPVLDQKQAGTRISQARIAQQQADKQRELAQQLLRLEVLRVYYGVLLALARKQLADEAVTMAEADSKRIRDMYDTGLVVKSDLLATEVQAAEFRQQQIQGEGDLVTAYAALNTAMGLPVDTPQRVTGELVKRTFAVETQQELLRLALHHRPDYARAGLSLEASEERTRGARGELLPRFELFGTFGVSGRGWSSGSSDYTLGASITINIFDAGRTARIEQARAAEAMAAAEQDSLASQIRLEVVRAYQQFVSARAREELATRSVEQASETLRIVQARYREGITTITEVLRAETTFVRAQMNALAARYDHYIGYAQVLLATGRLTDVKAFSS